MNVALLEEDEEDEKNGGDEDDAELGRGCLWVLMADIVIMLNESSALMQ